jgi:hypothetical protein
MKIFYGAGLNENQFPHPSEAASLSYNFDLQKDSNYLTPRRAFDLKGTAPNLSDVRGLAQLVKRNNTSTTLVQSGNTVYTWNGTDTSFSSVATLNSANSQLRDTYWSLDDYIVLTDIQKLQPVMKWDGSTFDTHVTGLAGPLIAKYGAVHGNRLWLANITESSVDLPHMILASDFDSATNFDITNRAVQGTFTTGLEAFYMLTPDLKPVNGLLVMHTDLIISTEDGKLYRLSGDSPQNFKWVDFYPRSNAIGNESIVNAGNDVFYMRNGGNIESVQATQNYGDVGADDISRWIPNTVFQQTGCIAVYDQQFQKVLFFLTGSAPVESSTPPPESSTPPPSESDVQAALSIYGSSTGGPGKVLVLYKDILYGGAVVDESGQKAKLSPWSVYRTSHSSNLYVSAAKYMRRPGTTDMTVYFGGPRGEVFDLNGVGRHGDAGTDDISVTRRIRFLGKEQGLDYTRHISKGVVQYVRLGECDFNIEFEYSGEYNTSNAAVHLKGSGGVGASFWGGDAYFGGNFFWGQADKADFFLSHQKFDNVGRGRVMTAVFSTTTSVKYQVNHVELPG